MINCFYKNVHEIIDLWEGRITGCGGSPFQVWVQKPEET